MNIATINLDEKQLIKQFGRSQAIFIAKVHYWIKRGETQKKSLGIVKDGLRWIFNSAAEWAEQLTLSARTIQNITSELSTSNIIFISKYARGKKRNTNCVTLNYDELESLGCIYNTPSTSSKNGENNKNSSKPSDPSNTTVQDMFDIWNRTFPNNQGTLTKDTGKFLYAAYKNAFSNSLSKWENYCNILLERNQKGITLEAAISFKTISFFTQSKDQKTSNSSTLLSQKESTLKTTVDNSTVTTMLAYWNTSFKGKAETSMTDKLNILLGNALETSFNNNMEEWKCYCQAILSSTSYIMTENFTLELTWALKPETIKKIFDKKLGVKEIPIPSIIFKETAHQHIEKMAQEEGSFCVHIRHKFIEFYGEVTYQSWMKQVGLRVENNQLIIITNQEFTKTWISTNYYKIFDYVKDNAEHYEKQTSILPEKEESIKANNSMNTQGFFKEFNVEEIDQSEFSNSQSTPQEFKKMMGWDKISYGDDLDKDLDFLNSLTSISQENHQLNHITKQSQSVPQETQISETGISSEARPLPPEQSSTEVVNKDTKDTSLIPSKTSLPPQIDASISREEGILSGRKLNTTVDTKTVFIHTADMTQKAENNEEFTTQNLRNQTPLTTQVLRSPYTLETNLQNNNLIKELAKSTNSPAKESSMNQTSPQVKNYNFTQNQEKENTFIENPPLYLHGNKQKKTQISNKFQDITQYTKTITLDPKSIFEQPNRAKTLKLEVWSKNINQGIQRLDVTHLEAYCEPCWTKEFQSTECVMIAQNNQESRAGESPQRITIISFQSRHEQKSKIVFLKSFREKSRPTVRRIGKPHLEIYWKLWRTWNLEKIEKIHTTISNRNRPSYYKLPITGKNSRNIIRISG